MTFTVTAFYKFAVVDDPVQLRAELTTAGLDIGVKGTVLVAPEGINGTVSGSSEAIAALHAYLRSDRRFQDIETKESIAPTDPFRRFKVRLKREIVTFKQPGLDPVQDAGTYVRPEDWNALIQDPDVVVVDTRNAYEIELGSFPGAVDPKTNYFSEFPAYVERELEPNRQRKIAMFCTGGIRCEKATAYLRAKGFPEVYHLQGGILKYLEVVPKADSLWQGECFIFDSRVSLEHGFVRGRHRLCKRCGNTVRIADEAAEPKPIMCAECSGL
jgi:UPF0176 protein